MPLDLSTQDETVYLALLFLRGAFLSKRAVYSKLPELSCHRGAVRP